MVTPVQMKGLMTTGIAIATRTLDAAGIALPELGFGAAALGNLYQPVSDTQAHEALHAGLSLGLSYVDTAPFYGFGLSERRVGDGVRGRREAIVSTKVGRLLVPASGVVDDTERYGFRSAMPFEPVYDYSYRGVMASWEASLQRLGLARIDILFVHDIGRLTHGGQHGKIIAQLTSGGGLLALEELRSSGRISAFGIGVNEVEICLELLQLAKLDVILLAGRYSLLEQGAMDALLPSCEAAGTRIVIGGPYNSGILATGTRGSRHPYYNYAPAPADIVARVAAIERVCDHHGVSLPAAALQFTLANPVVASVIPGLESSARVADTVKLYQEVIPASFWAELKDLKLLRGDSPVPGDGA